ncbi:L,D-transpeptidase family protein [Sneathiella chinensis]|uniref:L,D-TPase catalytic domain-containing protein n=1 Tax=Sneathiella chinensis TaxID=349750 RepID=A0ABQ5U384_9PROT|nr:L,D-transpeptidase family protein [Sneathiella chinensis]GLQ04961.1 hypothetical protein GCM10007924_01820 [Sneathiella chinensis]
MMIEVKALNSHKGVLRFLGREFDCALGKAGVTADKREGDHASPIGIYPLRSLYYRADRMERPVSALPTHVIGDQDGWCDDPAHSDYNRPVALPFSASHEVMKRDDDLYDLVVVLGHNDDPPVPGKGSCIFMHVAKEGYQGTEGCVALSKPDLLELLSLVTPETELSIS